MLELIENEKRILSLVRSRGAVSKPEIASAAGVGCGWATATKLVNRLVEQGFLMSAGTRKRGGAYGKNAQTFSLSNARWCALGLDVEKSVTTAVLVGLDGNVLWQEQFSTPRFENAASLGLFVVRTVCRCLEALDHDARIGGVGIGAPLPGSLHGVPRRIYKQVTDAVVAATRLPCIVENNVSAFADYVRHAHDLSDFVLLSIRTGVGGGVVQANTLVRGLGYAGELGHLRSGGSHACSCGRVGCLESEISLPALRRVYQDAGGEAGFNPRDLFHTSTSAARVTREHLAQHLATALADLRIVLDPPVFVIAGRFGAEGQELEPLLARADSGLSGHVHYLEIQDDDFIRASAQLFHRRFFY